MAAVKADGAGKFESELSADLGQVTPVLLAPGDSYEENTVSKKKVPPPGHDEVVMVTDLAGQVLIFGFNPKNADFFEVDGDLIAVLPNGGIVILEGYVTALLLNTPPILLYRGKPIAHGEILPANDQEFQLAPAGDLQPSTQDPVSGGTSSYHEVLDLGRSGIGTSGVGPRPRTRMNERRSRSWYST